MELVPTPALLVLTRPTNASPVLTPPDKQLLTAIAIQDYLITPTMQNVKPAIISAIRVPEPKKTVKPVLTSQESMLLHAIVKTLSMTMEAKMKYANLANTLARIARAALFA